MTSITPAVAPASITHRMTGPATTRAGVVAGR